MPSKLTEFRKIQEIQDSVDTKSGPNVAKTVSDPPEHFSAGFNTKKCSGMIPKHPCTKIGKTKFLIFSMGFITFRFSMHLSHSNEDSTFFCPELSPTPSNVFPLDFFVCKGEIKRDRGKILDF